MKKKGFAFEQIAKILLALIVLIGLITAVLLLKDRLFTQTSSTASTVKDALGSATKEFGDLASKLG